MIEIAITGTGIAFSLSTDTAEFCRRMLAGETSIKGHIGHSGASSGAMAMISGLYGMAEDRFTYIANTDEPDPEADFEIVHGQPKQMKYDTLQINSFGFGGQNASVVLTRT